MRKTVPIALFRTLAVLLLLVVCTDLFAGAGHTNYALSAQELKELVEWVVGLGAKAVLVIYSCAALLSMYSIATIYIKIQTGDSGFTKSIVMLIGSAIFIVSAVKVIPAMFHLGNQASTFWDSAFAPMW